MSTHRIDVRTNPASRPARTLTDELQRSFRTLLAGLLLVAVLLAALSWVLLGKVQPDLESRTELIRTLRVGHEATLEWHAALRGWLVTRDAALLADAERQASVSQVASDAILASLGSDAQIDLALVELELAEHAWIDGWAAPVAASGARVRTPAELTALFADGQAAFDTYREVQATATDLVATARDESLGHMQQVITVGITGIGAIVALVGVLVARQRRRLEREVSEPVQALVAGMAMIQNQEALPTTAPRGPVELRLLCQRLRETATQVREQQRRLEEQHAESEAAAVTLRSILSVAREIAGSLNVRYIAETVADAATRIAPCDRALVWLTGAGDAFVAVHDSSLPRGVVPTVAPIHLGAGAVGVVARDARLQLVDGSAYFPLVVGGRAMGVLELVGCDELASEASAALETLATHGAAALEAARLHRTTEELAQVDALTRLANRRRLDDDLVTELDRANRYGRPLGFVMFDLDHFKQLNDTLGHPHGDEVLRLVGETLSEHVRASDTLYRYGGEEFAVLVREGTHTASLELAERLREELARCFAEREGFTPVTASFGVAVAPEWECQSDLAPPCRSHLAPPGVVLGG